MSNKAQTIKNFDISNIKRDEALQARVQINQATVASYAKEMQAGVEFDPIILFQEGEGDKAHYWLADGWHRLSAYEKNETKSITVKVYEGGKRDAMLYAVGANAKHGLKRTNDDKRKAVDIMLVDKEWQRWSDQEIARRVFVDAKTVGNRRKALVKAGTIPEITERTTTRKGTTTTTNTKSIGKSKPKKKAPANAKKNKAQEEPSPPAPAVELDATKDTPPVVEQAGSNGHAEPLPVDKSQDVIEELTLPSFVGGDDNSPKFINQKRKYFN